MITTKPTFVIAIGASAGGLKALKAFFSHLDSDTGAAFVVIQHLLSKTRSELAHLLSQYTRMKVCRVTSPVKVEANHVYVLPEGKMMEIENDTLILRNRGENEIINKAVDIFFLSLAAAWQEKAVGVILSGTGADGLIGAKAIEENGGLVFVQEPSTTVFKGMPSQIVNHNLSSLILPPEQLAESLSWHLTDYKQ